MPSKGADVRGSALGLLLVSAVALSACNEAGALSAMPAGQLFAATSLSAQERQEHIRNLNWRISALAGAMHLKGREKPSAELVEELCECVVDNLQDRTTRMQFVMAMETIKNGGLGKEPNFSKYRTLALSKGMSSAEFDQQARDLTQHVASMAENCMRRLGGRG